MANDLVKAGIKLATAIVAVAFGTKVGKEGKKNLGNYKSSKGNNGK